YQAFLSNENMGRSWGEFKAWVQQRKYKKYKESLLLLEEDVFHPKVRAKFVARNLNDTRYSSRVILNTLQSFFYESDTKVNVINGSFTHTLRKKWGNALEKTRETYHHHAVDAGLCAVQPFVIIDQYKYMVNDNGE